MKETQSIFSALLESKMPKRKIKENSKVKYNNGFTGSLLRESEDDQIMDDVIDNIQVVTDPEKTVDDLEARADEIQNAIEESPEGEAAFSDEYVGKKVYACPVCGESFFAETEYIAGDTCPVCNAESADGFLLQGEVQALEGTSENEPEELPEEELPEEENEESTEEELPEEAEEAEEEASSEVENPEEAEEKHESWYRNSIKSSRNESAIRRIKNKSKKLRESEESPKIEVTVNVASPEKSEPEYSGFDLDEKSFEAPLNEFADENYSDSIDNIDVVGSTYDPEEDEIHIDAIAECRGRRIPLRFNLKETYNKGNRSIMKATESKNAFRVDSRKPAFEFAIVREGKTLRCESLKYSYTTTHHSAGRVKVEGYHRSRILKKKN